MFNMFTCKTLQTKVQASGPGQFAFRVSPATVSQAVESVSSKRQQHLQH